MIFVDTNYFLRFLLKGESEQQKKAVELLKNASLGKIKLFTSTIVIFEIYWVLSSFYKKDKKEIKKVICDILKMSFIEIKERKILTKAVSLLEELNYDFEDAYNLSFALNFKTKEFVTFDISLSKKFKEMQGD